MVDSCTNVFFTSKSIKKRVGQISIVRSYGDHLALTNITNHVTKIAFSLQQNCFYNGNI